MYIYQMTNTIEDPAKLADKLDSSDKQEIADALREARDWLSSNDDTDKEDYEERYRDLTKVCDPIIAKVYQSHGGQGNDEDFDDEEEFADL